MKKIHLLTLSLFSLLYLGNKSIAQDPKADRILKSSQQKFESLRDVAADFTYTISNPNMKKPIVKEAQFLYKKGSFIIRFPDEEVYCNQQYVWIKTQNPNEVVKTDYDPENSPNIDQIYSIYKNEMKSRFEGEEGNMQKISLFSLNENSTYWKVELWINKNTKFIDRAAIFARNGSNYQYQMKAVKVNNDISADIFEFDEVKAEEKGYDLIDMTE